MHKYSIFKDVLQFIPPSLLWQTNSASASFILSLFSLPKKNNWKICMFPWILIRNLFNDFFFNACAEFVFFYQISLNSALLQGTRVPSRLIPASVWLISVAQLADEWAGQTLSFIRSILSSPVSFLVQCIQPRVVLFSVWLCWGYTLSLLHPSLLQNSAI